MFIQRSRGRSVASLARELNERGVSCPSSADPGRAGDRWILRTVAMILENPRYTGRQVWNRQGTVGHGKGGRPAGRGSGVVRPNPVGEWEVSQALTHRPLVDDATFLAVQGIRAGRQTKDGETRRYALVGLMVCGICDRRMDAHWVHGRPGYRCRHGYSSAAPRPASAPRALYVREDRLLESLPGLFTDVATRAGPHGERARLNPAETIRRQRLQVVCFHESQTLRREAPLNFVSLSSPQVQVALDLSPLSTVATPGPQSSSGARTGQPPRGRTGSCARSARRPVPATRR